MDPSYVDYSTAATILFYLKYISFYFALVLTIPQALKIYRKELKFYHGPLVFLFFCLWNFSREFKFKGCAWVDCTLRMSAINKFFYARFVTTNAWCDLFYFSGIGFIWPFWVCKQWSGKHNHIAHFITQSLFC